VLLREGIVSRPQNGYKPEYMKLDKPEDMKLDKPEDGNPSFPIPNI
jgi:hypothetical protein